MSSQSTEIDDLMKTIAALEAKVAYWESHAAHGKDARAHFVGYESGNGHKWVEQVNKTREEGIRRDREEKERKRARWSKCAFCEEGSDEMTECPTCEEIVCPDCAEGGDHTYHKC